VTTWAEYSAQAGAALAGWMTAHPWTPPEPADPDPDPDTSAPTATVKINCGGPAVVDAAGAQWEADRAYAGGTASAQGAGRYPNDPVCETERWGNFAYSLTGLPAGDAVVRLHLAESYPADTKAGMRSFAVTVRGASSTTVGGIDPFAIAGGQYRHAIREIPTTVALDGFLTVSVQTVTNAGCLQGLEVRCYGTGTPAGPGPEQPPPTTGRWVSGGSNNLNDPAATTRWGTWRGLPCDAAIAYSDRNSGWGAFVTSHATSGQISKYTDKRLTIIMQTAPFPSNVSGNGGTYAKLLDGAYDAYWQQIGALLARRAAAGWRDILSLAWEANGTYMYWGGGPNPPGVIGHYSSPDQYKAGSRRIVDQVRTTFPGVEVAFTFNAHGTPAAVGTTDVWELYPGKKWVTYLGIDCYDHYPPALTEAAFVARENANAGLLWLADKARGEGLQIVVPEWGIAPGSGKNGGGDNPVYVQQMVKTFRALHAEGLLRAECYFADPIDGKNVDSDLMTGNPRAAAEYQRLYRSA